MKTLVAILLHVALAIFIVVTLWPALKIGSEGYNTKTSGVIVSQPAEIFEPDEEEMESASEMEVDTDITDDLSDTSEVLVESVLETEMPMEEMSPAPVMEPEVEVVEDVVDTPKETVPAAEATVHEVKAQVTAFSPLVVFIQPGDLVAWSNMNGHDTQSLEGLIPDGAEAWHSQLGEDYQRTFTIEGVYLYKCTPHFGTGMGGVIVVGNPKNMDAIVATNQKGAAKRLVKKALKAIEAHTF